MTHTEQSSTGARDEERQPRHQPRQEGLSSQEQQLLLRPQNGSALDRTGHPLWPGNGDKENTGSGEAPWA